ncbi:uncharacterized protein YoxC [Phyllobacterium trifolii]|uniref:Uncharacterized protein YoxC n=1 Tax=Phyllobacterium trifolii TaxID=300193 RepID=A0A839U393_9HYPH|nr:hypothetical protein [Phyllobacterium trifolii]MBB3144927.1 uncharacterized protein YoxC [Phyllobacterium trifolii]
MNDIMYPADEIEKSFATLDRTPAPLGHPMVNGVFLSASDPEGINLGWIGAWNENVRRENGRVFLDKVIDVEIANRSEGGKAVLSAIDKGEPVHTSTGLLAQLEAANGDVSYSHIARDLVFDHDAILLNEKGAATPEQGVGMMVNSKGEKEEIAVINSSLSDIDQEIDWAGTRLVEALRRKDNLSVWERMKSAIIEAISSEREPVANRKEADMTVSKEQFDELSAKVNTLSEGLDKIGETIANAVQTAVKPLTDNLATIQNNQKAKDDAELAGLVEKIVKANILDEDSAKELTLNAARKLAEKATPGKAAPLNGAFTGNADKPAFKLPEGDK